MFGISLVALALALGFAWLAKQCLRKKLGGGGGAPAPLGPASTGARGGGGLDLAQHWGAFVLYLMSGVCWAVALLQWISAVRWLWVITIMSVACIGLIIGSVVDIKSDRKPDRWAFWSARLVPALLLVTVWHWGTFTASVGDQVDTYRSQLTSTR